MREEHGPTSGESADGRPGASPRGRHYQGDRQPYEKPGRHELFDRAGVGVQREQRQIGAQQQHGGGHGAPTRGDRVGLFGDHRKITGAHAHQRVADAQPQRVARAAVRQDVQAVAGAEVDGTERAVVAALDAQVMRRDERIVDDHIVVVGATDRGRQRGERHAMGNIAGATQQLDEDHLVHRTASR